LVSGLQFYFALAREEIKPINEWDNKEVINWLN